jgi:hypothetical protein
LLVECSVVDWERDAALAPLYILASLYKHAKARHSSPVRIFLTFGGDMRLFLIYCAFLYMIQAGIDIIHYCCMDVVGWKRRKKGWSWFACWACVNVGNEVKVSRGIFQCPVSPMGLEPMPCTSEALTAQYLNVRQRKLGTISFILSISYSMIVRSQAHCPMGNFCMGNPSTSN